jgi:uncharacterized membrane protein
MAQEVMYETGKRKQKAAKAGKASAQPADQAEHEENQAGWEEQLWMNQAGATTEATDAWQADSAPAQDVFNEQFDRIGSQIKSGLQSLLNTNQFRNSATGSFRDLNDLFNDDRSMEELKRWSSLIGGGFLALTGLRRSLGSLALMTMGAGLVYYALTGQWFLSHGARSRRRLSGPRTGRTGSTSLDSNRPMTVKNILVKAPLREVYEAWANFENFPHFMQHIRAVTKTGDQTSHWIMEGPFNSRIEWDAETTRLEENKRIAWSSTGGDIKTSGQVTFNALPDNEVEVTVMLRYIPPAGIAGDLFASLFGDPEGKLAEDLRNFKRYIEKTATMREAGGAQ